MRFLNLLPSLIDRLCVIAGAFAGSQIPMFFQQYTQRLAGHVDELQILLNQLHQAAISSNKTLEQYIQKFTSNSDPDFILQGEWMQKIVLRLEDLHQTLYHLTHSSLWSRPFIFFKNFQYDIAQSTFSSFQPGINLSAEGICYAVFGMFIGWALYQLLLKCITLGYSRAMDHNKQIS